MSNGTTFGSTAIYTCDTGYTLSGSSSRTCRTNGLWTFFEPLCISKSKEFCLHWTRFFFNDGLVVDCGPLANAWTFGQLDQSNGTTFGSIATYMFPNCFRTCGADSFWTTLEPTYCQSKYISD